MSRIIHIACTLCLFLCLSTLSSCVCTANAQSIQLTGKLLYSTNDTTRIDAWCDGALIFSVATVDPFYAMILGEQPHYTIRFRSGTRVKYCSLYTYNMNYEAIQADVDFRSTQSVIIYKRRSRDKSYIFTFYGSGTTRSAEVPIYETQ